MNQQTDLSKKLRAHVSGHVGMATNTDNKLLLDAADEIERYYTGMLNWKHSAEAKDALAASGGNAAPVLTDEQIDTPEFMDLLNTFAHESSCEEYDEKKYKEARHALVNYIKVASAPNAALVAACTEGAQVNLPDFMEWIADRLEFVYGESPNVDFVRTCRDRAKKVRVALSAAGQEVKP